MYKQDELIYFSHLIFDMYSNNVLYRNFYGEFTKTYSLDRSYNRTKAHYIRLNNKTYPIEKIFKIGYDK